MAAWYNYFWTVIKMNKNRNNLLFILIVFIFFSSGCGQKSRILQIKGSDTMVNMSQSMVEEFMRENPEASVAITGGGSGTGVAALISGTADIAQCSRNMTRHEIEMANGRNVFPYEIPVAIDGIAVVVSPKNQISKLTMGQLSDIFSGKTTSWKVLGGPNSRIVALSRDRNSGTHTFFLEQVVKKGNKRSKDEFAKNVLMMPSTQAIVEEVSANPEAIGYIGLGYVNDRTKIVAIAKGPEQPYIRPTLKTSASGLYPISRALLFYTNGAPTREVKSFIDFALGKVGQKIVVDTGFVPLHKK